LSISQSTGVIMIQNHRSIVAVLTSLLALSLSTGSVRSEVISFDFESSPVGGVTITGDRSESGYTGDGHVVGPMIGGQVQPVTLGTSDGGVLHDGLDHFLVNKDDSTQITITFSSPIYSVSFDYEIFPDGTLPDGTNTNTNNPNWPDFTFKADGNLVFRTLGALPGDGAESPFSLSRPGPEVAPQFIGQSGTILFPNGVTTLEFIDWPRTIGIDNLLVSNAPLAPAVPEPTTLAVFVAAIGGGLMFRRRPGASSTAV
jgi:hypothetical protein